MRVRMEQGKLSVISGGASFAMIPGSHASHIPAQSQRPLEAGNLSVRVRDYVRLTCVPPQPRNPYGSSRPTKWCLEMWPFGRYLGLEEGGVLMMGLVALWPCKDTASQEGGCHREPSRPALWYYTSCLQSCEKETSVV